MGTNDEDACSIFSGDLDRFRLTMGAFIGGGDDSSMCNELSGCLMSIAVSIA